MKINIPVDASTLMLNGSNVQPGKSGSGHSFAKLLQENSDAKVDVALSSEQAGQLHFPTAPTTNRFASLHGEHLEQLMAQVHEAECLQNLSSLAIYQAAVGDELAKQLNVATPITTVQLASPMASSKAQTTESLSTKKSVVIEPHVQLAFANHVLAHRRDLANSHDLVTDAKTTIAPQNAESQFADEIVPKEFSATNNANVKHEAWPQANRTMESSSTAAKIHEELDSLVAIQQLLQEYQLFLRKQIIVSKNDERLFVYVRDYEASPADLNEQLNALKNVLQKKFQLPVSVVVNGAPQPSESLIFSTRGHHAS